MRQILIYCPQNAIYAKSPNGYMGDKRFVNWLAKVFILFKSNLYKVILILDGNGLHKFKCYRFKTRELD